MTQDNGSDQSVRPTRRTFIQGTSSAGLLGLVGAEGASGHEDTSENDENRPDSKKVISADTIYFNGKIVTLDCHEISDNPGTVAEAMAIRDGKVLSIGNRGDVMPFNGSDTEEIDLDGKTVLPGFVETHVHPILTSFMPDLKRKEPIVHMGILAEETAEATLDKIASYAEEADLEEGEWVLIDLIPNHDMEGVATVADPAVYWIGTPDLDDQALSKEDLTEALPNNPALAGWRTGDGELGKVHRELRDGTTEELFSESNPRPEDPGRIKVPDSFKSTEFGGWYTTVRSQLNEPGLEAVLEEIPDFVELLNDRHDEINLGDYGAVDYWMDSELENRVLNETPTPEMWQNAAKRNLEQYASAGITTFASRNDLPEEIRGFHELLRQDGRLPVRYAYGLDRYQSSIVLPPESMENVLEFMGPVWEGNEQGRSWLWPHGVGSESVGDLPQMPCMGPDLEALPEIEELAKGREDCGAPFRPKVDTKGLVNAFKNGWRIVGVHGNGPHALREWIQLIEQVIQDTSITEQQVREMRTGFAHGLMVGKPERIPDVVEGLKKYNVYVPINPSRTPLSTRIIEEFYGSEGFEFLLPVKSMLDAGVNVVGELEEFVPDPATYFRVGLEPYVTRNFDGEVLQPDEAVDRVVALKLFTIKAAEFVLKESMIGSLEPGKLADFIVVEDDYLEGPDEEISDNKVLLTVVENGVSYLDEGATGLKEQLAHRL